jgi:prepilin-type N-terminal cleavage/methylation domain-containing protein
MTERPIPRPNRRRGFTLIELVVVLALIVVISAIGFTSLQSHLPRYRLVRAVKAFKSDLMYLRNLSISSSRETRLRLVSTGGDCENDRDAWGGSWALEIGDRSSASRSWEALPVDAEVDGSDDDQSEGSVDLGPSGDLSSRGTCLSSWTDIGGPGANSADSIVFSPRGRLANPGTDFVDQGGWIAVTFINQSAARDGVDDQVDVMVNRVGSVSVVSSLNPNPTTATAAR